MKVYMHTINGYPAAFRGQIVYLTNNMKNVLRYSLDEIKAEQEATKKYRKKRGFDSRATYGYVMFQVNDSKGGK